MNKWLLFLIVFLVSAPLLAQEKFSSVEERMTGKEFMDAGLDKLTDEELAALNRWLRDHSIATLDSAPARSRATAPGTSAAAAVGGDERGFEGAATDRSTIVSRLVGEFDGWDGETVFELENGMVWKQDETDKFFTRNMVNPEVTIKSGLFDSWRLSVEGYNKSVKVERIQ
ncbi:MAG: hypothetical protein HKN58_08480 [Xanthomonadales bacterium]|nr:hypothetical protein [Xanthomonadales bacterium]